MANKFISSIYNALPTGVQSYIGKVVSNGSGAKQENKNMGNTSMQIPLQRLVQSVSNWRSGTNEAEYYIPFRVKQQQLYNDIIDEPHVASCMERRMDLTLQRDYIVDCGNDKDTEYWTKWLKGASWFIDYQRYILTAKFRGYTLVSLGNIVSNDEMINGLPELKMLEHSLISPDRQNFASVVYSVGGVSWNDKEYKPWHIYVDTPPEIGNGACGYGMLHKIAVCAILLRNNLTDWANYNERFGQPVTWGKTDKTDNEKVDFFNNLRNMGASATFVTDLRDELTFLTPSGNGQGFKTYAELKSACEKLVSKVILGHADVMDSIPKKSGASGSSDNANPSTPSSPVQDALANIASKDGKFVTPYNQLLLTKMRNQGVNIPLNAKFIYKNDEEEEIAKAKGLNTNSTYATIAKTMKDAGLAPDAAWFTKETGIPCKAVEAPKPPAPPKSSEPLPTDIKNKLEVLYKHKH